MGFQTSVSNEVIVLSLNLGRANVRQILQLSGVFALTLCVSVGCANELPPLPVPSGPIQEGFPPRLSWQRVQCDRCEALNGTLVLRNNDSFTWTMFDQIRLNVVLPNAPYKHMGFGNVERSVELICPPPPSVPPRGLLVVVYETCAAPWDALDDGKARSVPRLPADPDARIWAFKAVAREGTLSDRFSAGPRRSGR
jgi:hypothetical protein